MNTLVSIIVPIYNVEAYLRDCIDSLICQTLAEIEIILVDDGSTDHCGEICNQYAAQDHRIRVIHQENQGLSAARNAGIDTAKSDYLMFVDSDDWVDKDYCRIPYQLALKNNADIVMFQYSESKPPHHVCKEQDGLKDEAQIQWLMYHGVAVTVWNKLYHRKLFHSIRFPVGKIFEDNAVTHLLVHEANRIFYTNQKLYNHRIRPGSITHNNKTSYVDFYHLSISRAKALHNWGFHDISLEILTLAYWIYLTRVSSSDRIGQICRQYFSKMMHYPVFFSWRSKRMLDLFHISPFLFDLFCHILRRRKA